ncbi:hypothetical protein MRB53_011216 [Persea americana]|uniref:Uncharacterized protein n=1 Tax=Persea americana TaxID=3435 RepID=A0ACC2LUD5_PERAE|nr:hypothetical protein MRB53_011216 [Persea americana]
MHDVGVPNQESNVCLHLGLTDYRTIVGTNLNPLWEKFLVPSEDDSIRCQHTASPLGNAVVVETADKKILVLQRSYNVGEFPGHFVFPGGHLEVKRYAFSGCQDSIDNHRKYGANLEVDIPVQYLGFFLEDDSELVTTRARD